MNRVGQTLLERVKGQVRACVQSTRGVMIAVSVTSQKAMIDDERQEAKVEELFLAMAGL